MSRKKPSMTARKVALNLITLGSQPEMRAILPQGIVEATAKLLVASDVVGERTIRWARSPQMVAVYEAFDWMLPGQFEAFGHRKAFCEQQVRDGIKSGAVQVLVLGAGFDTLCWRLAAEFPGIIFVEIDHSATASLKSKGIDGMGRRENLHLIAEDLGERKLIDVLGANKAWNINGESVIIAEGLVMYLTREAVQSLFSQCAAIVGTGSRFAFSYIPGGEDGRPYVGRWTGLMLWLQNLVGEPWLWSIRPEGLAFFLQEHGWRERKKDSERHGVEFFAVATR
ncbi:MAG: SAM-dependent methyltransferase [Candidatus Electrothrix sp. AR4]|nr:SAM-dependent methyltransferase [Candidatus Electrothrix sp. AR4]